VVFFASGIYGHNVKQPDDDNAGGHGNAYTSATSMPSYSPNAYDPPAQEEGGAEADDGQITLCDNGNQFSCRQIADEYATGRSMISTTPHRVNWKRAIDYYCKACDHGDQDACMILAREYRDGRHATADPKRAFELFKKACGGFSDNGCAEMRSLSGTVGRLSYSNGNPTLAWHCRNSWCYADPLVCENEDKGSCITKATAFCVVILKGTMLYQLCATDQNTCDAKLKALVGQGATKVSECTERGATVPGQFAGAGWYCKDGFGSAECSRELASCQASGTSYGSATCAYQASAACVVVFNVVSDKYESKCYPSLQSCNGDSYSMRKDDYTERSACFVAK